MPRLSLPVIIPPLIFAVLVALFVHRWTERPDNPTPPPSTTAMREAAAVAAGSSAEPSSANSVPPPGAMNPVPAGTRDVAPPGNTPNSATPTAPSGEPARPQ